MTSSHIRWKATSGAVLWLKVTVLSAHVWTAARTLTLTLHDGMLLLQGPLVVVAVAVEMLQKVAQEPDKIFRTN